MKTNYKNGGLVKKYVITKSDGSPTNPNADYFVLRLDKDPHAQKAIMKYAESVRVDNPQLADDICAKMVNEYGWEKVK